ncbi:MAG: DUF4332 domain-containing protein [Candidatus Eisenbacteria bacterium]|uniref:DUF4332 domain-containing protein n=1 Tax=Eiseniibacteriota bacterium TaxID=2212470 RepID=A0A538SZN6_UNCEI|nr:MAG: DUF4332 domain-containing protein [Candidatus Eisenbacteria bacterium]
MAGQSPETGPDIRRGRSIPVERKSRDTGPNGNRPALWRISGSPAIESARAAPHLNRSNRLRGNPRKHPVARCDEGVHPLDRKRARLGLGRSRTMSLKMSEFHGIDPAHVTTLRTAGIENTDDLMKIWSDKEKRAGIVTSSGISEENFMRFAAMARLGRVRGMDLRHLDVLVAAGIDGPKRLFSYTPETLAKHLGEVVAERKLTGPLPTAEDIAGWFANPKPGTNGSISSPKPEGPKPERVIVN